MVTWGAICVDNLQTVARVVICKATRGDDAFVKSSKAHKDEHGNTFNDLLSYRPPLRVDSKYGNMAHRCIRKSGERRGGWTSGGNFVARVLVATAHMRRLQNQRR